MPARLISKAVWRVLKDAASGTSRPSFVAVAYFGAGADRLLPLSPGSRLVVDASLRAVRAGQTHPATLTKLSERGVFVYNHERLHAKVFVLGPRAYVGSANVSSSSEIRLTEAVVELTEQAFVRQARDFVAKLCVDRLSPSELERLQRSYRPPRINGTDASATVKKSQRGSRQQFHLSKLRLVEWPETEVAVEKAGRARARACREHGPKWEIQAYRHAGRIAVKPGDTVMQIIDEGRGRVFVVPPGKVLQVSKLKRGSADISYVYLEVPKVGRRLSLASFAKTLGREESTKLARSGVVRNKLFSEQIQQKWSEILLRRRRA